MADSTIPRIVAMFGPRLLRVRAIGLAGVATSDGLAATIVCTSSATGSLSVGRPLSATVAAISRASGDLSVSRGLVGSAASRSTATGALSVGGVFEGTAAAASSAAADLTVVRPLFASAVALSSASGDLAVVRGLIGTAAATSSSTGVLTTTGAAPSMQRVAITGTPTDSAGDATTQSAVQNSSTNKRDAAFPLSANQVRTITVPIGAVAAPGGLLYATSYIANDFTENPTTATASAIQQSTDGGATFTDLTLAQGSKLDRGLAWHIPAGDARTVTIAYTAGTKACMATIGIRQRPSSGRADIWLIEGPSFEDRAYKPYQMLFTLNGLFPAQDPMVFNEGAAGTNTVQIKNKTIADLPKFPLAEIVIANQGGNTVTATRPYSNGAATALSLDTDTGALFQAVLDAGRLCLTQNISYRDYITAPLVNANANPENGSLPYNVNKVNPTIQAKTPEQFDAALGVPYCDPYAYVLNDPTILSSDGVHPFTVSGYNGLRAYQARIWGAKLYGGALPASLYEQAVAAAEAGKTQALKDKAQTLLNVLVASEAKAALQVRLDAVRVPVALTGTAAAQSTATGNLIITQALTGTAAATSTATGTLTSAAGALSGTSTSQSTAAGTLTTAAAGPSVGSTYRMNTRHGDTGGGAATTDTTYNDLTVIGGATAKALKDTTGASSPLTATLVSGMNSGNTQATTAGAYVVPKSVADSFVYIDKTGAQGAGTSTQIKASVLGLEAGTKWRLDFFGLRSSATNRNQTVTAGTETKTVNVGTAGNPNNTTFTAVFNDVAPVDGKIDLTITQVSAEQFAYIGAFVLTRTA